MPNCLGQQTTKHINWKLQNSQYHSQFQLNLRTIWFVNTSSYIFTALESTTLTFSSRWIYFRIVEEMSSKVQNLQHNNLKIWRRWISQLILGFWIGESYNRCPLWLLGCSIYSPKVAGISSTLDRTMTNNLIQKQKLKILIKHEHHLVRLSRQMVCSREQPFYLVNWLGSAPAEICSLERAGLLSAIRVLTNFIFQLFFWAVHL